MLAQTALFGTTARQHLCRGARTIPRIGHRQIGTVILRRAVNPAGRILRPHIRGARTPHLRAITPPQAGRPLAAVPILRVAGHTPVVADPPREAAGRTPAVADPLREAAGRTPAAADPLQGAAGRPPEAGGRAVRPGPPAAGAAPGAAPGHRTDAIKTFVEPGGLRYDRSPGFFIQTIRS